MWYNNCFNIFTGGDCAKLTNAKLAKYKNNIVFQNVFAKLLKDALNRYYLENLPETCDQRVILQALCWYGSCIFFDMQDSLFCLPGAPNGQGYNIYGNPGGAWVWAFNGVFNKNVKLYIPGADEASFLNKMSTGANIKGDLRGVLVRENALMFPFIRVVIYYAECVADTMRTLDVCRENIKQPYLITAEESIINSVKKFFEKRNNNEPYIISSGIFPADKISLLPFETNAENLQNCTALIDWYENKFKQLCGFDSNNNIDKKGENLIEAEINIDQDYTETTIDESLKYIQEGLDQVNKIYGTHIKVKKKEAEKNDNIRGSITERSESDNDTDRSAN